MNFRELEDAVKLLADNPQVHPNTPVHVEITTRNSDGLLLAARVESSPRQIVLSDSRSDLDVAR